MSYNPDNLGKLPSDVFHPSKKFRLRTLGLKALMGAGIGESGVGSLSDYGGVTLNEIVRSLTIIGIAGLATSAGSGYNIRKSRKQVYENLQSIIDFRNTTGESVELIEQKDGKVLVWNGSLKESPLGLVTFKQKSGFIEELAEKFGCDAIAVYPDVIPEHHQHDEEYFVTSNELLANSKSGITLSVDSEFDYIIYESGEFKHILEEGDESSEEASQNKLAAMIDLLGAIDPNHPLCKRYKELDDVNTDKATISRELQSRARALISLYLGGSYIDKTDGVPERVDTAGILSGVMVLVLDGKRGMVEPPRRVWEHFGMMPETIDTSYIQGLTIPQRKELIRTIEIAITCLDLDIVPDSVKAQKPYEPHTNCPTISEAYNWPYLSGGQRDELSSRGAMYDIQVERSWKNRTIWAAVGLSVMVASGVAVSDINSDLGSRYRTESDSAETWLKNGDPSSSIYNEDYFDKIHARIAEKDPLMGVRMSLWDLETGITGITQGTVDKLFHREVAKSPFSDLVGSGKEDPWVGQSPNYFDTYNFNGNGELGNAKLGQNKPLWRPEAIDGKAELDGYWITAALPYAADSFNPSDQTPTLIGKLPPSPIEGAAAIKVTSAERYEVSSKINDRYVSTLPILYGGYKIVAANIDGEPVELYSKDGVSNIIKPTSKGKGVVTYWLAKSEQPTVGAISTMYAPFSPEAEKYLDRIWTDFRGPGGTISSDAKALGALDYSLNPLDGMSGRPVYYEKNKKYGSTDGWRLNVTEWSLLENKALICNTAAGIMTWSNPDELIYLTGIRNGATVFSSNGEKISDAGVLSQNESHSFNMRISNGKLVDATPTPKDPEDPALANFSESGMTNEDQNSAPKPNIIPGILAFLTAGYVTNRSVRFGSKYKRKFIDRRANNIRESTINEVYGAINDVLYSPEHKPVSGSMKGGGYTIDNLAPYANDAFISKITERLSNDPKLSRLVGRTLRTIQKHLEQGSTVK